MSDVDNLEERGDLSSGRRSDLLSRSFLGLLATQLLGAVNDNVFRWLVIGIGKQYVTEANVSNVLTAGTACFVLPYIVLAAPAGYLADRYDKRSVIVACKLAEIVIMSLGIVAILVGNMWGLFAAVALMGTQSALFAPSKLGSIPEMLRPERISAANGVMGLTTVTATVIGMAGGNVLTDMTGTKGQQGWWLSACVLIGLAVVGWLCSLTIKPLPIANRERRFPWDAPWQTVRDVRTLAANRAMLRVALGITFFWSLGALAQMNIDQFATEGGITLQSGRIPLLLSLVAGVGLGSVLAGVWSGERVELGILPLGAGGIVLSSILLFTVQGRLVEPEIAWTAGAVAACVYLFMLGTSAGLFDVPLTAYMQHRSDPKSRGAILAATNFVTFSGILVASLLFAGLRRLPLIDGRPLKASEIFLLAGLFTMPVFVYVVWLIPQASIRFVVWLASKTAYRIRVYGRENLPERGGALLVSNHVSWLDGILLLLTSSRTIRIIASAGNFQSRWLLWLADLWGVILITPGPKGIRHGLETARQALLDGDLVCIFPEGGITRNAQLQAFRPGLMRIVSGTGVPVIPVYLDELWGSIFSFQGGRFFWKLPRRWPYPISIYFGRPLAEPEDVHEVRQAVQSLGTAAVENRKQRMRLLPSAFLRMCKRRKFRSKVADSSGADLTGGGLLMRALIFRRLMLRELLAEDEQYVGVLLPPSLAGVVANTALALARRVAVNLNYTVSSKVMNDCIAQCGIRRVLTSRRVMEKMDFDLDAELVYLEDLREKITLADKFVGGAGAYLVPARLLDHQFELGKIDADDLLTVIFTSGSTGQPKGVMLTQANIGSNVQAIDQVIHLSNTDVIVGILPFFHSFGFTVPLWTVMALDIKGIYHFSPLDAKQIGKLCGKHGATVLLSTPTFLRSYLRRCTKEDFATLDVVVAGAEKLPSELASAYEEKFGVRPVEGYGTTELSPLVSVNVPDSRSKDNFQVVSKEGTVGRPVPGVTAKIVNTETGEDLSVGQPGMLLVRGPNVMKGYMHRPELTAEVVKDGWYRTGDIAVIDPQGFIQITGRESRFSKIGGEMVPHIQIEETLAKVVGGSEEDGLKAAVTAIPDARKGERLIVLHTALDATPEELCKALAAEGLPNLFIPSADSFCQVDELPVLGTGKLDLKGIKQTAIERFASSD